MIYKTRTPGFTSPPPASFLHPAHSSSTVTAIATPRSNPRVTKMTLQRTCVAVMVVAAVLLCSGMVAPAEGRALLDIGKLIDHLKPHCPPPPSDEVPEPYSEPSPADATPLSPAPGVFEPSPEQYQPPPYYASPAPVDESPTSPASYQTPPAPTGGY